MKRKPLRETIKRFCENCAFFSADSTLDIGECRRNAPVGVMVTDEAGQELDGQFPIMFADSWCGEWKLR